MSGRHDGKVPQVLASIDCRAYSTQVLQIKRKPNLVVGVLLSYYKLSEHEVSARKAHSHESNAGKKLSE
jgi:hypothetical protein